MKDSLTRKLGLFILPAIPFLFLGTWYLNQSEPMPTSGQLTNSENTYVINMVTGEFSTKTDDGKEIEAYRWDPGTVVVPKGQNVTLKIYGVNGKEHPFYIEGTDYKGVIQKGKESELTVRFDKEGTYRLICTAHQTLEQNGPMIGYIVVD
ncbi:cupredoxin domain-containing protein [Niallia sp. Krafla_26]|uniref:cupredoxin domain-containing protein n=1 Tax=Niallia sp. Krafla_26 TaxID=3064703 RepID=UPI003D17EE3E